MRFPIGSRFLALFIYWGHLSRVHLTHSVGFLIDVCNI